MNPDQPSNDRVVARNLSALMISQVATWAMAAAGMVVIPRYLGAELIGRFYVSNSLWLIAIVVAEFGTELLVPKEIARDPARTGPTLATSIAVRLVLFVPVTVAMFAYASLAGYSNQTITILAILGVSGLLSALASAVAATLQGLEDMRAISIATIVERALVVGISIALLIAGFGIIAVVLVVVAGALAKLTILSVALSALRRERGDRSPLTVDRAAVHAMLRTAAPYFGVGFFSVVYHEIDAIVISLAVVNDEVLGWYSVYDRLAGTLLFVPTVFMVAMYPTLSRLFVDDAAHHARMTQMSFRFMLMTSVPLGFGLATLARPLIEILFGNDFANAAPVMAVGGIVISLTYLNVVFGTFLVSMDRQAPWTRVIATGVLLTIPLDLILIPVFDARFDNGAIGGAVAYLITESLMLAGAIRLLPQGSLPPASIWFAARVVLAGLIMVGAVYPLRDEFIVVPILAGAVVYFIAIFAFRLVTREERELITRSVHAALPTHREG